MDFCLYPGHRAKALNAKPLRLRAGTNAATLCNNLSTFFHTLPYFQYLSTALSPLAAVHPPPFCKLFRRYPVLPSTETPIFLNFSISKPAACTRKQPILLTHLINGELIMKKILITILAFMIACIALADVVTIGTGTAQGRYPLNDYYVYSRSQMLYTSTEIGTFGTIEQLAWYRNDTGANPNAIGTTEIWLKMVSNSTLSGNTWEDPGTLVATISNIDLGAGGGWLNVDIDDFNYSANNLLVSVRTQNAPYTAPHSYWRYTSATNMARLGNSDGTNPPSVSISSSRPNIQITIQPLVGLPEPASNPNPANNAIGVALNGNLTWDFGADTDTYDLWFGPVGAMTEVVSGERAESSGSYSYTDLDDSAVYNWQVVSTNTTSGLSVYSPVWSFTSEVLPVTVFPFSENFDGTWSGSPAAPTGWTVVNANSDSYFWSQANTYISPTHSGTYAAHGMGNTNDYLITPPIDLTGIDARMKWWDKVESASYPNSYKVLLSTTDASPASFTIELGDFTCTNTAWTEHTINLDAYTGEIVYIAFYQYASAATNWGFGIDDFLLEEIPAMPVFTHSPTALAFPFTQDGTSSAALSVTVTNTGAGTLSFASTDVSISGTDATDFSWDDSNLPADLTTGQSVVIPVTFSPQSAGQKSATLVIYYNSVDYEVTLDGYAYAATANFEGFENTSFPPAGWANPGSWSRNTFTVFEGTGSAYRYGSATTPYILSTPKLEISRDDELVFMGRISNTTSSLDIVYSTDRSTWVLLQSITAPTANTWFGSVVDLSSLEGKGRYYLGFRTMGATSYYIDNVIMPPFAQEAPEAVTLTAPANAATNQSLLPTLTWTTALTGGIPTSFDIYLEASEDPESDPRVLLANVPASPYTLTTPLSYSTSYIWKVVAKNAYGDAPASVIGSFTTMADPTKPLPYSEDFNSGTSLATIGWTGTMSITSNHGTEGSNGLNRNMWSSTTTANGVTPPIGPMTDGVALSFDYRIVNYTGYPANATTLGASDKVEVQISTDSGASYTTIHTINQANHVSSTAFASVIVDLSTYNSGNIMLKFLCTWGTGDYYVDIDNVLVRVPPANPIFAVDPTEKDFGIVNLGDTSSQVFTISNQGAGTLSIESVSLTGDTDHFNLTDVNTYPVDLGIGQSMQISVSFSPIAVGNHSATLSVRDNLAKSKGENTVTIIGEGYDATISSFPYVVDFESATFLPEGWSKIVHTGNDITRSNSANNTPEGSYSARFSSFSSSADYNQYLFTAPIAVTAPYTFLSFWHRKSNAVAETLEWGIATDTNPASYTWTEVTLSNTAFQRTLVDLSAYVGQTVYIGFHYYGDYLYYVYLDDVNIGEPDYPEDAPITIGEGDDAITVTVEGGSAFNGTGSIPEVTNAAFVAVESMILELIGAGPWTITIETSAPWGAYYRNGSWTAVENVDGTITFVVEASKDLNLPIVLGPVDPTLPVTLASFTAVLTSDLHVKIAWMAESEVDHAGYNLLRSEVNELSTALRLNASMIDEGTVSGTQISYLYTDTEVYHNALYYYWLESVSLTGESEYFGPIMVLINANGEEPGIPAIPIETKLFSAFPNPFNPSTNLRYSMKEAGDVRIDVYNVKGQILKTFENHHSLPGYYQVNWDGRDMNGRVVGTGVYFYRMSSGKYSATKKMVLAK